MRGNILIVSLCVLALAGCASDLDSAKIQVVETKTALPPVPAYSETFRMKFADEVDHICGEPNKDMVEEYPHACTFIRDALELRARIKAITTK
jgi:hypothetical protein